MPVIRRESTNQRIINVQVNKYWMKVWYDEPCTDNHDEWWDMHIPKEVINEWNQGEVYRVYKEYMNPPKQIKTFDELDEDDVFHVVNYFAYTRPHKEWREENMLEDIKSYTRDSEVRKADYVQDEIILREFDTYADLKVAHQKDINEFPVCWLFGHLSEKEAKDELEKKLGSRNFKDYCYGIVGEILRKSDARAYAKMWYIHEKERQKFNADFDKLVDGIEYEMNNHEYGYTRDSYDTLCALGKGKDDLIKDERFAKAWAKAEENVFTWYDEHNM